MDFLNNQWVKIALITGFSLICAYFLYLFWKKREEEKDPLERAKEIQDYYSGNPGNPGNFLIVFIIVVLLALCLRSLLKALA